MVQLITSSSANAIKKLPNGGIYLYRNCGEGGTVRHQVTTEQSSLLAIPLINTGGYGIWLGSRVMVGVLYCMRRCWLPLWQQPRTMVTLPTTIP
jgi:hypothetical protein